MGSTFLFAVIVLTSNPAFTQGFNLDLNHPLIFSGSPNTLFGFTVALAKTDLRNLLFVGAPAANSSSDSASIQPGVISACSISDNQCREVDLNYNAGNEVIIGRTFNYEQLRDNGWLGVALEVSPDDSQFVACGHLWKDKQTGNYFTNGICYVASTNLNLRSIRRLLPLVQINKQVISSRYIYAHGLAGMAAHYVGDNSTLLIGAPGSFQMTGTVIGIPNYKNLISTTSAVQRPNYIIPIPNNERNEDSYFGYAVASGKFFSDKLFYYAAGAPREGVNGKAFIYILDPEAPSSVPQIISTVEGNQMGEYFGAALCAVDLNNDGFDDLIVGSPLYSVNQEEGRISVYYSDGTRLKSDGEPFVGNLAFRARFGTAIASIGDINLDGYQDIAVGAPYDDAGSGAMYIYHGSAIGLKNKAVQKIMASAISSTLRGFGMSISKGKDIDDNFYPDIAVGASTSANAVVLRAKPVVRLSGSLKIDVDHINTDLKNCSENGVKVTCFLVNSCVSFDGLHAPDNLEMEVFIEIDVLLKYNFQPQRVYYLENGAATGTLNFTSNLFKGKASCSSHFVHVKADTVDFLTPVQFDMSYKIKHQAQTGFCKTCPVIDDSIPVNVTRQLSFFTGCGEDDKCISDLHLASRIAQYEGGKEMVLGTEKSLQLLIDVSNSKEPAFQTVLHVILPPDVDYARIPSECAAYLTGGQQALACQLGNPLEAGHPVSLSIGIDLQKLTASTKELAFNISVMTASEEEQSNLADNFALLVLPIKTDAYVDITGWQMFESQFVYNRSNPGMAPITHMYQIVRTKPSPVQVVDVELKFPILGWNQDTFIKDLTFEVSFNNQRVPPNLCSSQDVKPDDLSGTIRYVEVEHGKAAVVDCTSMRCHVMKCTLGPFLNHEIAMVNITTAVDLPALIRAAGNADLIQLRSSGMANIIDKELTRDGPITDSTEILAVFLPRDLVPQPSQIAAWIIVLAVIGGIVLLAAIVAVFYKMGFFRRRDHEKLLEEEAKENPESDNRHGDVENETLYTRHDSPEPSEP